MKRLLLIVLICLSLIMFGCKGEDGDDGTSTLTLSPRSDVTDSGYYINWASCVTGLTDSHGDVGCISGINTSYFTQNDYPANYILTPNTAYNHPAGTYAYSFVYAVLLTSGSWSSNSIYTGSYTVEVNSGSSGEQGILPDGSPVLGANKGDDGDDRNYTLYFKLDYMTSSGNLLDGNMKLSPSKQSNEFLLDENPDMKKQLKALIEQAKKNLEKSL
jgi:hypothetical protein